MSTEPGDWKPEVGGKVWYFDPNEKQVIRCGTVSFQSEINADHYFLNGSLARHYTLLFPTAKAAMDSIRVYDLDGKEVVIPAVGEDLDYDSGDFEKLMHRYEKSAAKRKFDKFILNCGVSMPTYIGQRHCYAVEYAFETKAMLDAFMKFVHMEECGAELPADPEFDNAILALGKIAHIASQMEFPSNPEGSARLKAAQDRFASLAAGNEDPCDPSAREITTPTDKRNGDPC